MFDGAVGAIPCGCPAAACYDFGTKGVNKLDTINLVATAMRMFAVFQDEVFQ
jgi:hypothetical protein